MMGECLIRTSGGGVVGEMGFLLMGRIILTHIAAVVVVVKGVAKGGVGLVRLCGGTRAVWCV